MVIEPVIFDCPEDLAAYVELKLQQARREEAVTLLEMSDHFAGQALKIYDSGEEQARLEGVAQGLQLQAEVLKALVELS